MTIVSTSVLYNDHLNDFTHHHFPLVQKISSYVLISEERGKLLTATQKQISRNTFTLIRQSLQTCFFSLACFVTPFLIFSIALHLPHPFFTVASFIITKINTLLTFDDANKVWLSFFLACRFFCRRCYQNEMVCKFIVFRAAHKKNCTASFFVVLPRFFRVKNGLNLLSECNSFVRNNKKIFWAMFWWRWQKFVIKCKE